MKPTKRYEIERHKQNGGRTYYIFKVFEDGTRLLWDRSLLRQLALERAKAFAEKDRVSVLVSPSVYRRAS